jgi:Tic22-like family
MRAKWVSGLMSLGLLSSAVLGAFGMSAPQAFALPEEVVLRKLSAVPVFVVANNEGDYITSRLVGQAADGNQQSEVDLLLVFLNGQEAEQYVTLQRQQSQNFPGNVSVGWLEMSAVYQQAQVERDIPLRLMFVPQPTEVEAATGLNQNFTQGVPLFVARNISDGSYALLPMGTQFNSGEPILPMFFSRSDLESVLDAVGEANPEYRSQLEIEVVPLEQIISQMQNENTEGLELIYFFPDSDAINYIRQTAR